MIYHPYATMVMSILHRITGGALYFGTLLLVWWLVAAASGPAAFDTALAVMGSWFGQLVLFGYSWALLHHLLGGLRHLVWDTIHGLEKRQRDLLAWGTLVGSLGLTVLVWLISFLIR
jgi:succinate dehydrogenase / fumarate reductase cytochrome b subunit